MVALGIIAVLVASATIMCCVYMHCAKEVKLGKLDLKEVHTKCKHELEKTRLEYELKEQYIKKQSVPGKASESETATFFKILSNPTLLYEEDSDNGATRNN